MSVPEDPKGSVTPAVPLADVLQEALRKLVAESRDRIVRAADDGRSMLRVRALQRERDLLWIRLGKTAYRLCEAGELEHPALRKGIDLVEELEEEIRRLNADLLSDDQTP